MDDFYTNEQIGLKIKEARNSKGLTQTELGAALGVTKAAVARWESGVVKNIKRDMLQQIAQRLDMSPLTLIGFKDVTPEEEKTNRKQQQSKLWADAYADVEFSDDEFEDIMRYANFIISSRKK